MMPPARVGISLLIAFAGLLLGCGSGSTPGSGVGSISGSMIQPGVVDHVRVVRTSITSPVDPATGRYSLPAVPQGPLTLEFLDPNQRPFGYAQVVVQPDANTVVPTIQGPVINQPGDGGSLGPEDTSVPSVAASFFPVLPSGGPVNTQGQPTSDTAQVDLGSLSGQLLLSPGGTPLSSRPTLRLINVHLQGGPSGSVGQDPALDDPGLVAVNAAFNAGIDPTSLADAQAGGAILSAEDNAAIKNLDPDVQDIITSQAPPSTFFSTLQPIVIAAVTPDTSGRFNITSVPPGLYVLTPTLGKNGPYADLLFMRVEPGATTSVEMAFRPNP